MQALRDPFPCPFEDPMGKIIQVGPGLPCCPLLGAQGDFGEKGRARALMEIRTSVQITHAGDTTHCFSEAEGRKYQKSSGSSICHREGKVVFCELCSLCCKLSLRQKNHFGLLILSTSPAINVKAGLITLLAGQVQVTLVCISNSR